MSQFKREAKVMVVVALSPFVLLFLIALIMSALRLLT
jgi:hypothetical protein